MSNWLSNRRNRLYTLLLVAGLLALGGWLAPRAADAIQPDPVTAAWEKARAAGSYHFSSDVTQMTIPVAKVTNVGRQSRTDQLRLEGETHLKENRLEMQLWSEGGSILQSNGGVAIKVENGKSFVRQGAGAWQEQAGVLDGIAPQGDFLAYLAAVRDIQADNPERRGGIEFTRYRFTLHGPTFAAYVRDRMTEALRARGELPPGVNLTASDYFGKMTGDGELWVGADGLPLRQILNLHFPEQRGQRVSAQIVVDFSRFGQGSMVKGQSPLVIGHWSLGEGLVVAIRALTPFLALLTMTVLVAIILYYRRARVLQTALAIALILSMVVGPLLSTFQVDAFFAAQAAKAAAQEEAQAAADTQRDIRAALGAVEFNPLANPLESTELGIRNTELGISDFQLANLSVSQSPNLQLTDNGVDSDGDGLSDFVEERIGTNPFNADSDEDGLDDALEVKGFELGGKTWFLNPDDADSNGDGLSDLAEFDNNGDGQPDDTDGDGIPDVFDPDNDGDGVPDRLDLAPFSQAAATYSEATPLHLTLHNLTANKPVLVDFQVRPTDVNRLWYAFSVLDWPNNDRAAQVQDVDGKTYADYAASQGRTATANESYGDMKLIPMLEIRLPATGANLPTQNDLTPYNISVNNLTADGSQKVAYVPLNVVTDSQTGQRVAFNGRMLYLPDGSWPTPHDIRLVWVVQTLNDIPCDRQDAAAIAAGCAADGYIHNVPQVVQSYYDVWRLTGLNVSEQHGAKTTLIYEDPAVDGNLKDNEALITLAYGLDNSFLAGRDADNNGQRDVDIDEIARRFEHTTNSGVSSDQRWGLDNALNILKVERHDYATFDQAAIYTAMTDTMKLLTTQFDARWEEDNSLKPTIAYAYEQQSRSVGLDDIRTSNGYLTLNSNSVTVNLQPAGKPKAPLNTIVGLKWTHYCRATGGAWESCAADLYWNELESRYADNASLPGDPADPDIAGGRLFALQLHDLALTQGIQRSVQFENQLFSSRYTPKSDAELAGEVRTLSGGSKLAVVVIDFKIMRSFDEAAAAAKYFNGARQSLPKGRVQEAKAAIKALKNNLSTQKLRGAGVAVTTLVIVGGLTTAYYFKQQGQQEAAIAISSFLIAAQVVLSVYGPISAVNAWWTALARAGSSASILTAQTELIGVSRTANVIGAVLVISIVWGFFLYNVLSSDTPTASIEFNVALAEAIATTIYIILLTIISATVVGLILVGIVSVVDAILTAVCEFAGGSCFTIGGAVISALANAFYTYNLFIETNRADLIQPGAPQTTLADPNRGFVAGNDLRITLPITTHIVQKNPVSDVTDQYSHLFYDSLRATTFRYSLSQPGPQDAPNSGRGSMWGDWHRLHEVGRFDWYRLYGAYANTTPTPVGGFNLPAGLNRPAPFYLNMGYAIPAYDCWRIYVLSGDFPFYKKIPVCSERTINGKNSTPISSLRYDIFPSTFGGFVALAQKPGGGYGLTWDSAFTALRDADGDGLVSAAFGGLDPDDTKWDSDGDGLSDAFELEQRAAGIAYSPTQCDTDGDGLTDAQEAHFGTDPANPDSDNDGLLDREEVWHQVYNTTTCQPTSNWAGGWNVTINATTPFTIRVTSNPLLADSDGDGVSDLAEKQLAGQLDSQNRPYHPGVVNAPPVAVYTDTDRRFVAPGSNLVYTTTVVANTPLSPGVLDVAAPAQLGGVRPSYALNFNPATFSGSQTVVQQTALTAQSGLNSQVVALSSNVRTRLAPTGPATLTWEPVTFQSLGSMPQTPRFMAPTASTNDRQDSYLLATQTSNNLNRGGAGSVLANVIPDGALTTLFSSSAPSNSMGAEPLDVACNQAGLCLAVWSYRDHTYGTYDALRGVVLRADGQVQSNVAFPVDFYVGYFYPQVASDGVDFLVASEKTNGLSTYLAIQRVNTAGVVVSDQSYQIENPRVAAGSTNSVALDLAWLGDRYGVAWKFIRPTGGAALPGFYTGLIDRTGAAIGSLANLFGTGGRDITWDATGAPALAYDPVNNRSLVLYKSTLNNSLVAYLFQGSNITTFSGLKSGWLGDMIGVAAQSFLTNQPPRLAYNPLVNGWFLTTGVSGTTVTRLLAPDLTRQLLNAQAISGSSDLPIACPMVSSMPVADFRFEELPGATTFADSSLRNNATSCPTGSCPVGGAPGATDQAGNPIGGGPLGAASDYAVQFDGFENTLDVGNPLGSEFSIAFWYKAGSSSESLPFRVESGFALQTGPPDGFSLRIYNNINFVFFSAGGVATSNAVPTPLNNGAWRFVVATRTSNGDLAVHIDGNPTPFATASGSVTPAMFNTVRLRDGGTNVQLDNLRFYNVALSGGAIQALYNGAQSYCAGFAPSTYRWARVNASMPDTRGGKITASGGLTVTIDADRPSSTISGFTQGQFIQGNRIHIIGGNASDPTSGVGRVEISVNNGAFQPASGKASWAYDLAVGEGEYTIRTRAIDLVNNPESSGASVTIRADATAPQVTLTPPPATPIKITRNGAHRWFATLSGSASDPTAAGVASGLGANAVEVLLQGQDNAPGNGWQTATLSGNSWTLDYLFAEGLPDPTGTYTVSVRAVDNVGNRTPDNAATGTLRLDMSGPAAVLSVADAQRRVITNTLTLSGIVTDTGPIGRPAGVDKVELAFVSVEQIAALSNDITAEQADAQLNRTWLPVNLAQRGAGVSAWSFPIPSGLENEYQIDLRATDMLGNVLRSDNVWRGVIDTLAPRVTASAVRINNAYVIPNQVACQAIDRYIDESRFDCEIYNGNIVDRIFDNHPALQTLFPDRTILMGLSKSMTYWSPIYPAPFNVRACDYYGHCTTVNSGPVVIDPTANVSLAASASESVSGASVSSLQSPDSADPPGATVAAVVSPAPGNVVAADDTLNVTVAAESSALLKEVTVHLDGNLVQTLSFAQNENATRILRTFQLTGISEGQHTFVARATDWAGGAQDNDIPATFTVDRQPPTVTIAAATLTNADTWAVGSGVLRFNGTASDSIGLAAVQIREGNSSFVDVQFGNGVWQTALPVTDPEGRSLHITVRAIDRAGRMSQATQTIGTDLSSPDAPDTTITSGPANPSATNTAGFEFSGSESAVAFACQLDESAFAPCASPWSYSDLSKGEHTFRVRAIDGEGNVDLTPASYTWTVNASALDATITGSPANPSSSRAASFTFAGTGSGFECSLDGAAFTPCTNPTAYSNLSYGDHSFAVRAVNGGGQAGAAARYTWTILNTPPVANDQSLTTLEDEALAVMLTASDADSLTYQVVTPPAHGVLVGAAPTLSYLPDSGFSGNDSFTFRAFDGQSESNLATISITVEAKDNDAPISTIALEPATPQGQNGWYTVPVRVTVTATDGDDPKASGVAETRCVLDPASAPAAFADLPAACPYTGAGAEVTADGVHTIYAASRDNRNNSETPLSLSFQLDRTPPLVSVTGVSGGATYRLGAVPAAGCDTSDATAGVASAATVQVSGGNAHGVGSFTATCAVARDNAGNASTPVSAAYTVGYDLSRFVLLGQEGVALGLLSEVNSGDVGARASGNGPYLADNAEVSIGQQARLLDPTSRVLGNRLAVKLQARVYNPSYNHLTNNGQVLGTTATPLNLALLPALPTLPPVTPGTQNLSVAQFGNLTINPGRYGALTVNQYATVTFSGGVYHFQSWSVNQYAKLYFAAPTEIRVAGRVNVVQYSMLAPAPTATNVQPGDIVLYVAGQNGNNGAINASPKAAVFGQGSTLKLNVVAPNGTVQIDQLTNVTGALLGRWVSVGQQVKLTLASAFGQPGAINPASTGDPAAEDTVAPVGENPPLPPLEETPTDEEDASGNDDENALPVEEEPLPSIWTDALFLPLVTGSPAGNAGATIIETEVFEEPTATNETRLPEAMPAEPVEPDGDTATRIFLPVVTQ